uniref:Uncharacterized protein n=1 Tax=viral metagenome TaxID=1070528 RepID=A0A6C0KFV8_9ZZZZ
MYNFIDIVCMKLYLCGFTKRVYKFHQICEFYTSEDLNPHHTNEKLVLT